VPKEKLEKRSWKRDSKGKLGKGKQELGGKCQFWRKRIICYSKAASRSRRSSRGK
jgi:hypothetical protein